MKRKQKLFLSPEDAARQREIARRLKLGLPLTGLLAAALFCGCGEQPPPHKPKEDTSQTSSDKRMEAILLASPTVGIIAPRECEKLDNRKNEDARHRGMTAGEPIIQKEKADK